MSREKYNTPKRNCVIKTRLTETEREDFEKKCQRLHMNQAVRNFLKVDALTAELVHELIDHIVIHETQGTGRNRTQQIEICYRFVGFLDVPCPDDHYTEHIRQGVEQQFITHTKSA